MVEDVVKALNADKPAVPPTVTDLGSPKESPKEEEKKNGVTVEDKSVSAASGATPDNRSDRTAPPESNNFKDAYDAASAAITEDLAKKIKEEPAPNVPNVPKLVALLFERDGVDVSKLSDDDYKKMAEDLIVKRELVLPTKDGKSETFSIAAIDTKIDEAVEAKILTREQLKGFLGAETLDAAIPDTEKRHKIASAVASGVEENTGFSLNNIMNFVMAFFEWMGDGFNGNFMDRVTELSANDIKQSVKKNLTSLSKEQGYGALLTPEKIDQAAFDTQEKVLRKEGLDGKADELVKQREEELKKAKEQPAAGQGASAPTPEQTASTEQKTEEKSTAAEVTATTAVVSATTGAAARADNKAAQEKAAREAQANHLKETQDQGHKMLAEMVENIKLENKAAAKTLLNGMSDEIPEKDPKAAAKTLLNGMSDEILKKDPDLFKRKGGEKIFANELVGRLKALSKSGDALAGGILLGAAGNAVEKGNDLAVQMFGVMSGSSKIDDEDKKIKVVTAGESKAQAVAKKDKKPANEDTQQPQSKSPAEQTASVQQIKGGNTEEVIGKIVEKIVPSETKDAEGNKVKIPAEKREATVKNATEVFTKLAKDYQYVLKSQGVDKFSEKLVDEFLSPSADKKTQEAANTVRSSGYNDEQLKNSLFGLPGKISNLLDAKSLNLAIATDKAAEKCSVKLESKDCSDAVVKAQALGGLGGMQVAAR